ncbi:conserved hypothetical protein [Echinococcus multilocularis]|uniref:Uncharacterized protein n=1 Tax=Echinococcus multilocularis TaxID=6211 RepID=A0A068Y5W6_ECHMU|nr:conserved hypothetical protein [Echinococcus multilocularis]
MQRTPRQGTLVANKDKGLAWSNMVSSSSSLPTRRPSQVADLEIRIAAAEKFNQQILHDIAGLKDELQLSKSRLAAYQSRGTLSDGLDSGASLIQTPPQQRSKSRAANSSSISDLLGKVNIDQALQKLSADLQTVNSRCGSQALDIQNLYQELKNFDSKVENTLRNELRCLQAEISANIALPKSTSTNKSTVPSVRGSSSIDRALQCLEAAVAQIERKLEQIQSDRLRFENTVQNSLLDQTTRSSESDKSTKEAMVELRSMLKSNAQEIISSRQNVRSELEELSNQLNHRVTGALEKLQDELNNSRTDLEAALGRFSLANSAYESRLAEVESGLKKLAKELPDDLNELREDHQTHQKKLLNSLAQLDLAVEVLEQGLSDEKEQLKGVVAAEIKARTSNIFTIQTKLQELEESTKEAALKLNSSVGEIQERLDQLTSQKRGSVQGQIPPGGSANISAKLKDSEKEAADIQADGQRDSEEFQKSLKNIAEAVQAVKVGLLAKMEKLEDKTNMTIQNLVSEINELKGK